MSRSFAVVGQLRKILESATTVEGRLVISAFVVIFSLMFAALITPILVERLREVIEARLLTPSMERYIDRAGGNVDIGLSLVHFVRVVQLGILGLTGLALLVVWGLTTYAVSSLTVLGSAWPLVEKIGQTIALVVGAYIATGFLEEFVDTLTGEASKLDQHQGEIVFRVLQVSVIIVVSLIGLNVWGAELGGLLVGAGFLGIVVGMAARQTLGSMLAGFVLMFSRPFEVGDWIEVDGREGIVTDITIVNTRIENFDGEYVVLPNDSIGNSTVINRTRKGRLRLRLQVGIDYAVDPEHAEEISLDAMTDLDEVMPVPRPQVVPTGFGDSSITLELRFWIDNPSSRRKWRAKGAVIRSVYQKFDEAGIKIPYPQRELSGRQETGGLRITDEQLESSRKSGPEAATEE